MAFIIHFFFLNLTFSVVHPTDVPLDRQVEGPLKDRHVISKDCISNISLGSDRMGILCTYDNAKDYTTAILLVGNLMEL